MKLRQKEVNQERRSYALESDPPNCLTKGKLYHNLCLSLFLCKMGTILSTSQSCDYETSALMENT